MPEPYTFLNLTDITLGGLITNVVSSYIPGATAKLYAALQSKQGNIPANHDIQRASRRAFANALLVLRDSLQPEKLATTPEKDWLNAFGHWAGALAASLDDDKTASPADLQRLTDFDRALGSTPDLIAGAVGKSDDPIFTLRAHFHDTVLAWLTKLVPKLPKADARRTVPACLADRLRDGFAFTPPKPAIWKRIFSTTAPAKPIRTCLFDVWAQSYFENLKQGREAFRATVLTSAHSLGKDLDGLEGKITKYADRAFERFTTLSGDLAENSKLTRSAFTDVAIAHGILTTLVRGLDEKLDAIAAAVTSEVRTVGKKVTRLDKKLTAATKATHKKLNSLTAKLDAASPLQLYFTGLREHFTEHDNVALPVTDREGHDESKGGITIQKLFVHPRCADHRAHPAEVDVVAQQKQILGELFIPLLEMPAVRIVLLADPGMGKSTVIQWLIATLASNHAPDTAPKLRGAVPIPFILRELRPLLPDGEKWDWDALLRAFLEWNPRGKGCPPIANPLAASRAFLDTLLDEGRVFFLIDGLDEIGDPAHRTAIRDAIWEGFERHKGARFLITSRVVGYEVAPVHVKPVPRHKLHFGKPGRGMIDVDPSFGHFQSLMFGTDAEREGDEVPFVAARLADLRYLTPFDDAQQHGFAEHWYTSRMTEHKGKQRAKEFIEAVHRNGHTRVIGRVPNLLYLLALLYRHRAELPNGRALVYKAISEAYLETIPSRRGVMLFTLRQKEDLLATVGIEMQRLRAAKDEESDGDILVTRAQLGQWLGSAFPDAKELDFFLDHIARTSGLLLPRGEGEFGFAHLSFQEFYAACRLNQEFDALLADDDVPEEKRREFAKLAAQPVWHEPLLLLVERLSASPPFTRKILKWMFPKHDALPVALKGYNAVQGRMPVAAAQLLATLSIDPEVALDDTQREAIWKTLWTAHIAAWAPDWNIAPSLVVAANKFHAAVFRAAVALMPMRFHLYCCTSVSNLTPLADLASLEELILTGCTSVSDLASLAGLRSLQSLGLSGCTSVSDLTPFAGLRSLQSLNLSGCTSVSDLASLAGLASLEELILTGCTSVSDLASLAGLRSLQSLNLSGCTSVSDLTPLAGIASLTQLWLDDCTSVSKAEVAALKKRLPKLHIEGL